MTDANGCLAIFVALCAYIGADLCFHLISQYMITEFSHHLDQSNDNSLSGLFLHVRLGAWLAVNHTTSVTSGELFRCSKRVVRASELGSCQTNLCHS